MFRDRPAMAAIMPDLVRHATLCLWVGRRVAVPGPQAAPVLGRRSPPDAKRRPEGRRVKHCLARNWVRVYGKASALPVETTINNPRESESCASSPKTPAGANGRGAQEQGRGRPVAVLPRWASAPTGATSMRSPPPTQWRSVAALSALCRSGSARGVTMPASTPSSPPDRAPVPNGAGRRQHVVGLPQPRPGRSSLRTTRHQRRRTTTTVRPRLSPHGQAPHQPHLSGRH